MALQDTANSPTPDNLFAATQMQPVVADEVTVASGNNLVRGTVLGKVTSSGEVVAVDDSLANGAEAPYAILAEDTDATDAAKAAPAYFTGEYNENALTFGGDDTADDHRDACRNIGIFLKGNVPA